MSKKNEQYIYILQPHEPQHLKGNLTSEIGLKPRIKLTVSLNGIVGPRVESDLCSQLKVDIMQHSKCVCPPKQGLVDISYSIVIPYWWLKKGNYTLHVEMYATDGGRMTDFEGTTWRNGEAGESDGWFRIEKWKGNG